MDCQLLQEVPVWPDPSLVYDVVNGILQQYFMVDHQVCQNKCGGAADTFYAVH